jgi:hypothetical protein
MSIDERLYTVKELAQACAIVPEYSRQAIQE